MYAMLLSNLIPVAYFLKFIPWKSVIFIQTYNLSTSNLIHYFNAFISNFQFDENI